MRGLSKRLCGRTPRVVRGEVLAKDALGRVFGEGKVAAPSTSSWRRELSGDSPRFFGLFLASLRGEGRPFRSFLGEVLHLSGFRDKKSALLSPPRGKGGVFVAKKAGFFEPGTSSEVPPGRERAFSRQTKVHRVEKGRLLGGRGRVLGRRILDGAPRDLERGLCSWRSSRRSQSRARPGDPQRKSSPPPGNLGQAPVPSLACLPE